MQSVATSRASMSLDSRAASRACARRAETLRSRILGLPKRAGAYTACNAQKIVSYRCLSRARSSGNHPHP